MTQVFDVVIKKSVLTSWTTQMKVEAESMEEAQKMAIDEAKDGDVIYVDPKYDKLEYKVVSIK